MTEKANGRIRAKLSPASGTRRVHDRYELELEVLLRIHVPKEPVDHPPLPCKSGDLSAQGMGICVDDLPVLLYRKLITRAPSLGVEFTDPTTLAPIRLNGHLAWIDYRKGKATEQSGPCRLGVCFRHEDESSLEPLVRFIQKIETV